MKIINYSGIGIVVLAILILVGLLVSCDEDEGAKNISVNQVFLHNADSTTGVITQARVGTLIRIDGSGFSTLRAVYCNGVKASVNPNYVTETSILFSIPSANTPTGSDAPEDVRNTIRLVTDFDDYSHSFLIQGPSPSVSGVSHSLPKDGDVIKIYGTNLKDLRTITFPGNVSLSEGQFEVNDDYTAITCAVPAGATATPGSILVVGDNGAGRSHNFMNRAECVFLKNYWGDAASAKYGAIPYSYGDKISGDKNALLPATGDGPKNPSNYRQVPADPGSIAINVDAGGFFFRPWVAVDIAATKSDDVAVDMSCNNAALQFDYYIPVEWSSGFIRVEFISGNSEWRYDFAPWAGSDPIKMTGWQTATIPLGAFSALTGKPLSHLENTTFSGGANGAVKFINGPVSDSGGNIHNPAVIDGFQWSFGNFRIVPYTK